MTDRKNYIPQQRAQQVERELRLARAVEAYRMFYPSVSSWSFFADLMALGMVPNQRNNYCQNTTDKNALTPNSDTPYAVVLLDATAGPVVLEIPAGHIMGVLNDWYFQEAGNVGLPGPDGGKGGRYLIVGPEYTGEVPTEGYYIARPATNHCLAAVRAVPAPGQTAAALQLLSGIKTYPLGQPDHSEMVDFTQKSFVASTVMREATLDYWRAVYDIINTDVLVENFYMEYGRLAAAGIQRGQPFPQDKETQDLLLEASAIALEQMMVEALCSTRADRLVWPGRRWEWAGLVVDTGFLAKNYMDVYARDRWFYQATLSTKKMFPRQAGVGSIYLLGTKDAAGNYLDGAKAYRLHVPGPVPANQFWSLTVYNVRDRSEINTAQKKAAISSLHDRPVANADGSIDLYIGGTAPQGREGQWIQTTPGEGWFVYFRLYGPGAEVFDGRWQLPDFEEV